MLKTNFVRYIGSTTNDQLNHDEKVWFVRFILDEVAFNPKFPNFFYNLNKPNLDPLITTIMSLWYYYPVNANSINNNLNEIKSYIEILNKYIHNKRKLINKDDLEDIYKSIETCHFVVENFIEWKKGWTNVKKLIQIL